MDFCRARQIAGIMIPTRSMITRNSAIFQPHVTGASEAIAIPNPTMQSRTMVSFPPLMRASSCSRRSTLWRPYNGVSSSAIVALPLMRVLAQKHTQELACRGPKPRARRSVLVRALRDARGSPPWTPWTILCRLTSPAFYTTYIHVSGADRRDQHARASRPHPERDHHHWNPPPASLSQQ